MPLEWNVSHNLDLLFGFSLKALCFSDKDDLLSYYNSFFASLNFEFLILFSDDFTNLLPLLVMFSVQILLAFCGVQVLYWAFLPA